jgi:tetratricopeptide (TPR) repeat protein
LRRFTAAQKDLERAASLDPKRLDAFYHLGLAHYFQGQFVAAADAFRKGLALAPDNDNVIDCSNWLYVSPDMTNKEPHLAFYLRLLRFYQGAASELQTLPQKPKDPNDIAGELAFDTVAYGVGNWQLYSDDPEQPEQLFPGVDRQCVERVGIRWRGNRPGAHEGERSALINSLVAVRLSAGRR